jgi:hypothetical protein
MPPQVEREIGAVAVDAVCGADIDEGAMLELQHRVQIQQQPVFLELAEDPGARPQAVWKEFTPSRPGAPIRMEGRDRELGRGAGARVQGAVVLHAPHECLNHAIGNLSQQRSHLGKRSLPAGTGAKRVLSASPA